MYACVNCELSVLDSDALPLDFSNLDDNPLPIGLPAGGLLDACENGTRLIGDMGNIPRARHCGNGTIRCLNTAASAGRSRLS